MEVIEIGTGCGNIAISLARHLDCVVYATDISMEALRVASRNAKRLGVKEKIHLICGRLFLPFKEVKVDAILSNPPYIPTSEWEGLPLDVRGFEPRVALDGGLDGLDLHRDIIKRAPHYLKDGGLLALEIGFDQSTKIIKILEDYNWSSPSIIRDHKGLPRLILASKAHFC
jgi:release factor glutamine methyltransferase